ncbi:MAG: ubiquinone/menaquinone biosynthesis methyltransferase, partial [Planctomycetes bacterium]|nr:ubiquinone/menaquinone biosynthesis methyltransferase [Planctomycetota bacterium]
AGLDVGWRRRAAAAACPDAAAGVLVIDVCCGTGDLAAAVLGRAPAARVIACDFCRPMLERARRKFDRRSLWDRATVVEADALALPLPDAVADAATCAFGLRNLTDPARGLAEMVRVVRPGGPVVVLEFHQPRARGLAGRLFGLYFRRVLPRLGAWIARDRHGGYAYLVASIDAFGPPRQTAAAMEDAGLADVAVEPLAGGIASVYAGRKPG